MQSLQALFLTVQNDNRIRAEENNNIFNFRDLYNSKNLFKICTFGDNKFFIKNGENVLQVNKNDESPIFDISYSNLLCII